MPISPALRDSKSTSSFLLSCSFALPYTQKCGSRFATLAFNCGFVLSMLCPVDAPVCECDCRRINRIYVAEFEAGKFSFMLRLDFFMPH